MPWQDSWHPHFIRHSQSPRQGLRAHPMATLTAQAAGIFVRVVAGNGRVSSTRKPMINWLIYMLNDFVGPVLISPKFCCGLRTLYGGCGQGYMYIFPFILFNGRREKSLTPPGKWSRAFHEAIRRVNELPGELCRPALHLHGQPAASILSQAGTVWSHLRWLQEGCLWVSDRCPHQKGGVLVLFGCRKGSF